ncbi:hypothetical protein N6B98_003307 [Vibrio metschnikovii]|nr:hypothetical protein [Vibrio metschnikovii]
MEKSIIQMIISKPSHENTTNHWRCHKAESVNHQWVQKEGAHIHRMMNPRQQKRVEVQRRTRHQTNKNNAMHINFSIGNEIELDHKSPTNKGQGNSQR